MLLLEGKVTENLLSMLLFRRHLGFKVFSGPRICSGKSCHGEREPLYHPGLFVPNAQELLDVGGARGKAGCEKWPCRQLFLLWLISRLSLLSTLGVDLLRVYLSSFLPLCGSPRTLKIVRSLCGF
jgi:hypothetical protein